MTQASHRAWQVGEKQSPRLKPDAVHLRPGRNAQRGAAERYLSSPKSFFLSVSLIYTSGTHKARQEENQCFGIQKSKATL